MKILLIDDDSFILKIMSQQIDGLNSCAEVFSCTRAEEALAILKSVSCSISLLFCDLQMPGMDGVEFLRELHRIKYKGGVVLMTGEDESILQTSEKLAIAHKLNVRGALLKPVSRMDLKNLIFENHKDSNIVLPSVRKTYSQDELQQAIRRDELVNYYQPKVDVASGEVTGVETLVRWLHPTDGIVFPDQFITVAEEHGLIDDLTRVVLKNSLHQINLWKEEGLSLQVSVNISMDNLTSLEFPERVIDQVSRFEIDLNNLILEVTESRLMSDQVLVMDILARLRLKRVRLSIDDFGTGNSSLVQLRDMPFGELKIDRGFVHGACRNQSLDSIFKSNISMAHQLNMKVVAEGVEDIDDWNYVRKSACDVIQGYFVARPMPAENISLWMAEWELRYCELMSAGV